MMPVHDAAKTGAAPALQDDTMDQSWLNQTVQKRRTLGYRCWLAIADASLDQVQRFLLDELLAEADKTFKHDRTTTVARVVWRELPFVLKRYNARNHWHKVKRALRRSRAQRCWLMSYEFQRAGLAVAPPQLMFEHRVGPFRKNAYFMNGYLHGPELLAVLPAMSHQQQQQVALGINQAFSKMRQHRLSHGDMKASNLLWVENALHFIDLDAAQQHRSTLAWRIAHRRDVKRFLKNWQDHPDLLALFSTNLSDWS